MKDFVITDEMEQRAEQRLAETFGDDLDIQEPEVEEELVNEDVAVKEPEAPADAEEVAEEPTPEPEETEEPADEPDTEPAPTPESAEPETVDNKEGSGLNDSLYRAAVHQGWTPDEIRDFYQGDPDKAVKTFQRMYESTNKLTAEFARVGRAKQDGQSPAPEPKAQVVTQDEFAALKEQYGEDDPLVKTLEVLQSKVETLTAAKPAEPPAPLTPTAEEVALQQTVEGFFTNSDMQPFNDFYGDNKQAGGLQSGQFQNRMAVLQLAENILTGAQSLGRKMEIPEALSLAHLTISEPVREKAIRSDLKAKLVRRSKAVSLEPKTEKAPERTGPLNADELESKVADKLKNVFG